MDQPGEVANPARGWLIREINISLSAFAPENLVSGDGFGSPVPRSAVPFRVTCILMLLLIVEIKSKRSVHVLSSLFTYSM